MALVDRDMDLDSARPEDIEGQFHALRRLFASKAGFAAFTNLPTLREKIGSRVVKALSKNNEAITHAVLDMLGALMQPMHDDYDLRQEQINKASLMSSKKFMEGLLEVFVVHAVSSCSNTDRDWCTNNLYWNLIETYAGVRKSELITRWKNGSASKFLSCGSVSLVFSFCARKCEL